MLLCYNEYKSILLNKKWLRHSMNRIQNKDHRNRICEISNISLSWFDDKKTMDVMD